MAVTRFGSQIKPEDSTEKIGYMFYPVQSFPAVGLTFATPAAVAAGMPALIQAAETTAATIISAPQFVPNDLDTSQTCYVSIGYASQTTDTTATVTWAVTYQDIAAGNTITTPAVTCGAITGVTLATTVGYFTYSASAAMSTKPTPGNLLAFKIVTDPLVADTLLIAGIKMQYTKRFL
jgi:hypothetical protein